MRVIQNYYSFKNLYSKFIKDKQVFFVALAFSIVIGIALNSISPYIYGATVDYILKNDIQKVKMLLIIGVIINIFGEILGGIEQRIATKAIVEISNRINIYMLDKCLKSKLNFVQQYSAGELLNRINSTGGEIISFYVDIISNVVMVVINIIISLYFMVKISERLLVVAILFAPTTYFVNLILHNRIKKNRKQSAENMDSCIQLLGKAIENISGIKLCRMEEISVSRFASILGKHLEITKEGVDINVMMQIIQETAGIAFGAIIVYISAIMIKDGTMTIGSLVSFNVYLDRLFTSIRKLLVLNISAKGIEISVDRFTEIASLPSEFQEDNQSEVHREILEKPINSILVKNLSFSYAEMDKTIENLNFKIEGAGLYLFVGENGCGKSSVLKLLSNLYDSYEGVIKINNVKVSDIPIEELREKVFFVEKNQFVMTDSILKNICLKDLSISMDDVNDVCEKLGIRKFILDLEKGYNTVIGEDLLDMSSGQIQRLILARTLLNKKAELFLLDETTSDLDVKSEKNIIRLLKVLSQNKIIIMITHRLHIAPICDKVFYFEKGKISESGTHHELLNKSENYNRLYNMTIDR